MKTIFFITILAMQAVNLRAQNDNENLTEKLLVPVPITQVEGAFGSRWNTTLVLTNVSTTPINVQGPQGDCQLLCPQPVRVPFLKADTTVNVESMVRSPTYPPRFSARLLRTQST